MDYKKITNPGVLRLNPYIPGKPIEELRRELGIADIIKMASNENPLGTSPKVTQAITNAIHDLDRYPDSGYALKQSLTNFLDIKSEQITLGAGTENILFLIAQTFLQPENEVLISEYSFALFEIFTHLMNAKPIFIPCKNWHQDLSALAKAISPKTRLIFLANPNNPTGTWNTETELLELLNALPEDVLLILDEAYYEYMQDPEYPNSLQLLKQYPNLIVTRTFSKAYGLAGLRIGYSISHPEIAELLNRARLPFNVNTLAIEAAIAALDDQEHLQESMQVNQEGYQQLTTFFHETKLKFIPSVTNFITVEFGANADFIYQSLLQQGIIIRPLKNYHMDNYLRISIGTQRENNILIKKLRSLL